MLMYMLFVVIIIVVDVFIITSYNLLVINIRCAAIELSNLFVQIASRRQQQFWQVDLGRRLCISQLMEIQHTLLHTSVDVLGAMHLHRIIAVI